MNVTVTEKALQQGLKLALGADAKEVASTITRMVKSSAPFTHKRGNRRFEDFIFDVDVMPDRTRLVRGVFALVKEAKVTKCAHCNDMHWVRVYDECENCAGEGCARCDWEGTIPRKIPCQDCAPKTKNSRRSV